MYIDSATLIKYNANTRGTSTGDCTTRAISLAFNKDYPQIKKMQNESAKQYYRGYPFNYLENCKRVIRELGGGNMINPSSTMTVEEFVDSHSGTYIIWCGKTKNSYSRSTHLVCVINDRVYDSWDSRNWIVKGYWEIKNGIKQENLTDIQPILKQRLLTDRDIQYYNDFVGNIIDRIISKNKKLKKIKEEVDFDIDLNFEIYKVTLSGYTFTLTCNIDIVYTGNIRPQTYPGKIVVVFKPTMKSDEIDDYFYETFFNKFYSYLYGIILKIEDTCEGARVLGNQSRNYKGLSFYDLREKKCFESLPYWVKALATYFRIEVNRWGYDETREIVLYMKRPHFDKDYNPEANNANDEIDFRAESMEGLRKGLEYYKNTGDYGNALELSMNY